MELAAMAATASTMAAIPRHSSATLPLPCPLPAAGPLRLSITYSDANCGCPKLDFSSRFGYGRARFQQLWHSKMDRGRLSVLASAAAAPQYTPMESSSKSDFYTVGDFMTRSSELILVQASTTVDEAIEMLVSNRVTGLPVVDENGKLIGVVSDYDLLALDSVSGKREDSNSLFPEAGSTWKTFKEIQRLLTKTQGKTVGEVMTPSPLVVRETTNLEDAARLLLDTKYRRLPVVDSSGKLVGLITRGNVIRAALHIKRASEQENISK